VRTHGARVPEMTMAMLPGPYRIPAYRVTGHFRLTNKTPAATYRAPGRYEGSFVRERLLDAVADRLGLDRVLVRRRNLITAAEMPFTRALSALGIEIVYDSGDYALLLDKALAKKILSDVDTPEFQVLVTGREKLRSFKYPVIVKPNQEGTSKGIHAKSVCDDEAQVREVARNLIDKYGQPALVEEYIFGREFTVGLLGEKRPRILPP